jgi:hypothetical protein
VVLISGPEHLVANRFVEPLGGAELVRDLTTSLHRTWEFWNRDLPLAVTGLLVLGLGWLVVRTLRLRRVPLSVLGVTVCLTLVLAQRVAPFERVWLFLLPVYLLDASAGLLAVAPTRLHVPGWAAAAGSLLLSAGLGGLVLQSGSILASTETGAFPDAQAVTQALRPQMQPADAVSTLVPASLPELQYYFRQVGLPLEPLVRAPQTAERSVFVIEPRTLDERGQGLGVSSPPAGGVAGFGPPRVVGQFPTAALLRLDRSL